MASDKTMKYLFWTGLGLGLAIEYPTMKRIARDARQLLGYTVIGRWHQNAIKNNETIIKGFEKIVRTHPNKIMLISCDTDEKWTFQDVDKYSNQVAHFVIENGYQRGDVVGLFMTSSPRYVATFLGLAKAGVVAALVNTNLRDQSLHHCIKIANFRGCIVEDQLMEHINDIAKDGENPGGLHGLEILKIGPIPTGSHDALNVVSENLDKDIMRYSSDPLDPEYLNKISVYDSLVYIYTSGTTGLPKAASWNHLRLFSMGIGSVGLVCGIKSHDTIYCPLPLFHTIGFALGIGGSIYTGATLVLRKKFSAKEFWSDCVKYNCTAAEYIGETNRFLLAQPICEEEKKHSIKLMYGVGMNKPVWEQVVKRFKIPEILEFYGSTEGSIGSANKKGKIGSIGSIPLFNPLFPGTIIKIDEETGDAIRDPRTGLCIHCKANEVGEFVGIAGKPGKGVAPFQGYVNNSEETNKKLLHNVWKKGDVCFRTGDLMYMDDEGWVFFKDRIGDTFRWRGENVSTTEVEAVISKLINNLTVVVYGVKVPGEEGRAGMAAICDPDRKVNVEKLGKDIRKKLPAYAQPLFIRVVKSLELTGTYKLVKRKLLQEGFDLTQVSDEIFYKDPTTKSYVKLDPEKHSNLFSNPFSKSKL